MNKLFSIVTAHLNDIDGLKITAKSIKKQNSVFLEWIVVDGDGKYKIDEISDLIKIKPNHLISEKDKGIADAWNKGIKISRGKYILILNCGDILMPNFISDFKWVNEKIPCIHSYHAVITGKNNKPIKIYFPEPNRLKEGMTLPHNFTFVPKIFYEEFGLYRNYKLSMDYEWFLRNIVSNNLTNRIIPHNKVAGIYPLGGISDKFAIEGFYQNLILQIKFIGGIRVVISAFYFFLASAKHIIIYKILNKPKT